MYTEVVMPEGSDLAFHVHEGESETYYILTGTGIYNDNGTKYPVKSRRCRLFVMMEKDMDF